jgi:signal transduction histidine kinase/ActR/RegA family two-component response regulator
MQKVNMSEIGSKNLKSLMVGNHGNFQQDLIRLFHNPIAKIQPDILREVEFDSACDLRDAVSMVQLAIQSQIPYRVCFVDGSSFHDKGTQILGWEATELLTRLWAADPDLQVVFCSEPNDSWWGRLQSLLNFSEKLILVMKPLSAPQVQQISLSLIHKRNLIDQTMRQKIEMDELLEQQTASMGDAARALYNSKQSLEKQTRELVAAREKADSANRLKSQFLANMSHELRTPLTAILGYTGLLADERSLDHEKRLDFIQTIQRNGNHLLELINDILDLSKIEADRVVVEKIRYSTIRILEDVIELMRVRAESKGISLILDETTVVPEFILTDPTRVRQTLLNLLGNAIKFTEFGSVTLRVELDPAIANVLRFDVLDTGLGMTPRQIANLFKPFTQADESTTRKFGGTGLGLTISRRLAVMLGGDVVVIRSEPGNGTHFRFTLTAGDLEGVHLVPLKKVDRSPLKIASLGQGNPPLPNNGLEIQGIRVLLAEDGQDNQRLITFHLKKAGAVVEVVENGRLAVEAIESRHDQFDVVLMDMQMPELDGYSATQYLRQQGYLLPIIALTAHAMEGDREKCTAAGCTDYSTKPINKSELLGLIRLYGNAAKASVVPLSVQSGTSSNIFA